MTEPGADAAPPAGPEGECTFVLGYTAAVVVADVTFVLGAIAWNHVSISVPEGDSLALGLMLQMMILLLLWLVASVPFALLRMLIGFRCVATAWRAMAFGALLGLTMLPFVVWLYGLGDFLATHPTPFLTDLYETLASRWPLYAISGATGGLVYWLIEVATFDGAIAKFRAWP
ncbi:conserved membrane protein of unknown function [Rhodovastum atsumiense]|uniref:Uncharacterized protein n=1 Tax=Rhodovastum atsumiense TaxID=504468 RepID=A0A5M6ILR9_9PROT|nr:hypothetical protein [Rhodovastum atsumiense]KAA5608877.1 hypothetical protein F1189_26820 [Rhodovastum atsumiense]CAH2602327.1 conserved membrane protein of unknown function [Rhodovastum atsumiense]